MIATPLSSQASMPEHRSSVEIFVWATEDGKGKSGRQPLVACSDEDGLAQQIHLLRRAAPERQFVIERRTTVVTSVFTSTLDLQGHAAAQSPAERPLTQRMWEVAEMITAGRTTKEIARALGLSVKTIETHRMHLMARLGVHNAAGVIRFVLSSRREPNSPV